MFEGSVLILLVLQPLNFDAFPYGNDKIHTEKFPQIAAGTNIDKSKWMTLNAPLIKDFHLGEVILPGTHNSGSYSIQANNAQLVDRVLPSQITYILSRVSLKICILITDKVIFTFDQ